MSNHTKTPLASASHTANHIAKRLAPFCHRLAIAGSIRRQRPFIGAAFLPSEQDRTTSTSGS